MLTRGQRIGRYEILEPIGAGGMAAVYRVRHAELGSTHALKILGVHREVVAHRLLQEGRSQAALRHPNVVRVHDVLTHDGAPVLVMEFVDGGTLLSRVERGRLPVADAVALAAGIAEGLGAAHAIGLVHRDLKLANVLLAAPSPPSTVPVPRIADFGLVKVMAEAGGRHTRTGTAMGTPEYMAPEQMRDASRVDPRADVYSLGCVLYAMLTGRLPYTAPDLPALYHKSIRRERRPLEEAVPGLPAALVSLVGALLEPDPSHRPADGAEVAARLRDPRVFHVTGPTTMPPEALLALAAASGPEWAASYGDHPATLATSGRAPARGWAVGFAVPTLAALLAFAVPLPTAPPLAAEPPSPEAADPAPLRSDPSPAEAPPDPSPAAPGPPPPGPPPSGRGPEPAPPGPAPPEPPPAAPPRVRVPVSVEGDATRVWLVRRGRRVDVPGSVAPGRYEVVVVFPGTEPGSSGEVDVGSDPVTLTCSSFARRCRPIAR